MKSDQLSSSVSIHLGDEVEECPHAVLEEQLVGVVERDAGGKVALDGAPLRLGEVDGRVAPELLAHLEHPELGVVRRVRSVAPPAR